MQAYRTYSTIEKTGCIVIEGIPFKSGDPVEVLIVNRKLSGSEKAQEWKTLLKAIQMSPQSQKTSEKDIAREIRSYRRGR